MTSRKGFTVIEMIVAVGLFSVVVSIAAGGFINALRAQRQAAGLIAANSNVSLAIEQIAREIRTGVSFCAEIGSCITRNEIAFRNGYGEDVVYRLEDGAIKRGIVGGDFEIITAANVRVHDLVFILNGTDPVDGLQPRITMVVKVSSREPVLTGNIITLQTTVTSRLIDG